MNKKQIDLTTGSITKNMILYSIPLVLSFLLQSLYGIVDLFIIGRFGGLYSTAAVTLGSQIMDFINGIAMGFLAGGTILISQYSGRKERDNVQNTIGTALLFMVIIAVVLTVLMLALTGQVMTWMQTPAESYEESVKYYQICISGCFFIFGYNLISSILNGLGDSKTPLKFVIFTTVLNMIGDYVLVAIYHMGAAGAAYATVCSQAVCFILGVIYLLRKGELYGIHWREIHIRKHILKNYIRIGIPNSLQNSLLSFSLTVLIGVANSMGVYAGAVVGICGKLNVIFILPIIALNSSLAVIVGHNMGAGKPDRVVESCKLNFIMGSAYAVFVLVMFFFLGSNLVSLFTTDAATIALGGTYWKGHCWDYLMLAPMGFCLGGLFSGTGHTEIVAIGNAISGLISRIPLAILLARILNLGVFGIGLAYPISTALILLIYAYFVKKGVWKESVV